MRHRAEAPVRTRSGQRRAGRRRAPRGSKAALADSRPPWSTAPAGSPEGDPHPAGAPAGRAAGPSAEGTGAGAAEPVAAPAERRGRLKSLVPNLPYAVVLAGLAAALLTIRQGSQNVQGGTLVLAGVLIAAAAARLVLPDGRAGMLSARRRMTDVTVLAVLGVGLLVAGLLPTPS